MCVIVVFFFKQKTAYEMRISDWSSDVCSSDLCRGAARDLSRSPDRRDLALHRGAGCIFAPGRAACRSQAPLAGSATKLRIGRLSKRSEEHTSELQSLMRISYAVFCLKKKNTKTQIRNKTHNHT